MEKKFVPEKIFLDKASRDFSLSKKILKKLKDVPVVIIDDVDGLLEDYKYKDDPIGSGKKALLLTRMNGSFIKPCPCTPAYVGCSYQIINADINCPYDCSYCILQQYLNNPLLTVHVNTHDLWSQLDTFLEKNDRTCRIGTGELGDSLVLDHITERSTEFIEYFRKKKKVLFELKTKSVNIDTLVQKDPPENVVIAWSLNSREMAREEEHKAPDVDSRIEAARNISDKGYKIAFHFDPLMLHPGWLEGYKGVVDTLLTTIDPKRIAWISLGSLRFPPALKTIIRRRFPETKMLSEELIRGKDGKFRYFKPLRLELYRKIFEYFQDWIALHTPFYFCMESQEVWEKVLKIKPREKEEVEKLLSLPPR
jgi:spore photoproduct lyase